MMIKINRRTVENIKWCADFCRKYWPDETKHIIRIADEVKRNEFLFDLPWDMERTWVPVIFHDEIDWEYMPGQDPEFIYQLNRHRYWICLGQAYALTNNEAYTQVFMDQFLCWVEKNPLTDEKKETTWRSIEAGIRAENWIKAISYFVDSPILTEDIINKFIEMLEIHGDYLFACERRFSEKSNWGVLESHGLYMIGSVLSDHARSEQYRNKAVDRLTNQLNIQVMDDGVHWEQSPMYHNEVLRCILEVIRISQQNDDQLPICLYEKARAMLYANMAWIKPDYTQPVGGDSDQTDVRDIMTAGALLFDDSRLKYFAYEQLDFESIWDYGQQEQLKYQQINTEEPIDEFYCLPNSGNWYLHSKHKQAGDYFHFRCGSLGGGHGHVDKLHIDLSLCGEDVLIDGGRYTYVNNRLRKELKSSFSHNTLIVDGKDYCQCLDSWKVANLTRAVNAGGVKKGNYTYMQGSLPNSMITVLFGQETGADCNCEAVKTQVVVPVTGYVLSDDQAEGIKVFDGNQSYYIIINHQETGADQEYIGVDGHYGLGQVMVCEEHDTEVTVLQW